MDNYANALKMYGKGDTQDDVKECPKCKRQVLKQEFNNFYGICDDCVAGGGKIG